VEGKRRHNRPNSARTWQSILPARKATAITGKLISAQWDPWEKLHEFKADLNSDIYALRRIVPKDRGRRGATNETTRSSAVD